MTTLFGPPTVQPAAEKGSIAVQLRQTALKGFAFIGTGSIAVEIVSLLKEQPDRGFGLLKAWGPWVFLAGGFLIVLNNIATQAIRAREKSDTLMSNAIDRMSVQQERLASAAELAAGKDDRQIQQMEILVSTVVMQSKRVLRRLHAQDRALERLEDKAGINRPTETDGEEENDEP